jgi:hypothetical protein
MTDVLPPMVAAFVAAKNARDVDAQLACFAPAAVVLDEGHVYHGHDEIRGWIEAANARYSLRVRPLGYAGQGENGVLDAAVSGDFPGSPLTFRYRMRFGDDKIVSLRPEVARA